MTRYIANLKRLHASAQKPQRQTSGAAGYDLHSVEDCVLKPGEVRAIGTGIALTLVSGTAALVCPRSGLASRGITVANSPGVIDPDYRGEIKVLLQNLSGEDYTVRQGDRIAQLLFIVPYQPWMIEVEELDTTERGTGGFGSTGR